MKYNFGVLKGQNLWFCFDVDGEHKDIVINNIQKVKQTKRDYTFYGIDRIFTIHKSIFDYMSVRWWKDMLMFSYTHQQEINGFVGFTMFDVYGFPIELTEEILSEQGFKLDTVGFSILRKLQREMNKSTFKNKNAFQ